MANTDFVRQLDYNNRINKSFSIQNKLHIDFCLLILLVILATVGLLTLYSASGQKIDVIWKQLCYLLVGFSTMLLVAQIPPRTWMKCSFIIYFIGIILLILVLAAGTSSKGAQRWLSIFNIRFQPAEIMKFIMPVTIASYIAYRSIPIDIKSSLFAFLITFVPVTLIYLQPDLGTAVLVLISCFFVIFIAGLSKKIIFFIVLTLLPVITIFWKIFMYDYQKKRVLTFLNPENDPWKSGWNIIQSKIAIGSGGLLGKGWLQGTQAHLDFLPERHTDFIISVFAEEFGFFGCMALIILYLCIILRCVYIAMSSQTLYGRLLASSIALTFFMYVFINMGMVSGILPVVGVPLPLVSKGGTAVLTLLINFGLIMAIHAHKPMHNH